jgi:hypothetical protein
MLTQQCTSKIVVFDMDETLGYYMELGMFYDALKSYIKIYNIPLKIDQDLFNKVLDLFPEFLRPNIINILNFLKNKKKVKHCHKLMIYTNNQGPVEWAQQIKHYFEQKINYPLFDQIINAFKVNGKHVEICRTSHMKTHKDFIRCTKVPANSEICFLDDVFHPGMENENIYYINIKPYTHDLSFDTMIQRFTKSGIINDTILGAENIATMQQYISDYMKKYNYIFMEKSKESVIIDKILSKKIMQHLQIFFNRKPKNNPKRQSTKKQLITNKSNQNKTKKQHNKTNI